MAAIKAKIDAMKEKLTSAEKEAKQAEDELFQMNLKAEEVCYFYYILL